MDRDVTKKVRLTPAEAKRLARIAKAQGVSESEVLRQGLARMDRRAKRKAAAEELIKMTEGQTYEKVAFRLR